MFLYVRFYAQDSGANCANYKPLITFFIVHLQFPNNIITKVVYFLFSKSPRHFKSWIKASKLSNHNDAFKKQVYLTLTDTERTSVRNRRRFNAVTSFSTDTVLSLMTLQVNTVKQKHVLLLLHRNLLKDSWTNI